MNNDEQLLRLHEQNLDIEIELHNLNDQLTKYNEALMRLTNVIQKMHTNKSKVEYRGA